MVRHKEIYWKCIDCGSMINDENMHEVESAVLESTGSFNGMISRYAEFCYGCANYYPEVVIAYD